MILLFKLIKRLMYSYKSGKRYVVVKPQTNCRHDSSGNSWEDSQEDGSEQPFGDDLSDHLPWYEEDSEGYGPLGTLTYEEYIGSRYDVECWGAGFGK